MTDIGSVRAFLTVDSSDYDKGLDGAERKAESFAKRAQKSFDKVGKGLSSIGRGLTVGLTLPLAAAGAGFIKLASDAEETQQKFDVVFAAVADSANEMADSLAESFGFAADESRELLGDTGDLLTGFEFSQQAALDLSVQVNTLAADLASFTNLEGGAARASEALTKALLGETEQAKALGIVIRQDSEEYKELVSQQMTVNGLSLQQAKAIAALTIATNQSKNAIGDFARTADSFANQMRIMRAESRDMAVSFGKQLLPVAKALLSWARDISEAWGELNPRTQRLAIVIGAVAAAAGPLLFVAGKIISGFGALIGFAGTLASGLATLGGVILSVVTGPLLAIAAGIVLVVAATSDLIDWTGLLSSAWNFAVDVFRSVATFFADFGKFFRDENAEIGESTRVAIEFIAKAWLSLRIAWNAVLVGLKTVAQGLIKIMQTIISPFRAAAEALGLDIAEGLGKAERAMGSWIDTLEESKTSNFETIKEMSDAWGKAPEVLRGDVNKLIDTFKAIPAGIMSQIESAFPGTVEAIRNLVAQVQEFVNSGAVPAIEVPVVPTFGGGAEGEPGGAESLFLTAFDTTTEDFLAMNEEITASIDEIDAKWKEALIPDTNAITSAWRGVVSTYSQAFSQISGLYAKGSAEQKAFAITSILLDTAIGIMKAMELPYPLNWAQAAAVGILGATQLANVGGGGSGGIGEGGGASALPQIDTAIIPQATQSQVVGDPETGNLGAFERTQKLFIEMTDENGQTFLSWAVDQVGQGKGDGVQTFQLTGA